VTIQGLSSSGCSLALGLAWDVKIASEQKIARRLAHQASQEARDLEHE
jgi:hypothetical protein